MIRRGWILGIILVLFLCGCADIDGTSGTSSVPSQDPEHISSQDVIESEIENTTFPSTEASAQEEPPERTTTPLNDNEGIEVQGTGRLEVHFIDVGQGASQLVIYYPSADRTMKKTMLIDGGDNDDEQLLVEYLEKQNIDTVDIVIGTHPHADHIGGLDAVIDAFNIGKVYMPPIAHTTKTFEDVLDAIANKGLKITAAKSGLTLDLHEHLDIAMIGPVRDDYDNLNNASAVVRLEYGGTSFLFTGDAEAESEEDMLYNKLLKRSDVLTAGHHGSNTSSTQGFLDVVKPSYVIIQSGKGNSYGHPHREPLQRFDMLGASVYRNDLSGHIIAISDGKTIEFHTSNQSISQNTSEPNSHTEANQTQQDHAITSLSASASIDNHEPSQNDTVTVTVTIVDQNNNPVRDAKVTLVAKYKSTDTTYDATTDTKGKAVIPFRIGRAALGYEVKVRITATKDGISEETSTAFTPK